MPPNDMDPTNHQFLEALYAQTGNDTDLHVSMYDIGTVIGLDRQQSSTVAEDLMAEGILEIRTLSGGVALSEDGQALFSTEADDAGASDADRLGQGSPMDEHQRGLVEQLLTSLKAEVGAQSFTYEALAEMMADVRTIEAQLTSPRAKTVVVRTCLEGLCALAVAQAAPQWQARLEAVLR